MKSKAKVVVIGGGAVGVSQRAHPAGIKSISLPLGLSHRRSLNHF